MSIKKLLSILKAGNKKSADKTEVPPPETFKKELNRWCNTIIFPVSLLAMGSWPLYIQLDLDLYQGDALIAFIIVCLRWGFTAVGGISFALQFTSYFKKRGYWLIMFIETYLILATGLIVGWMGADPVYLGGFSIVILTIALLPIQRIHALTLLFLSLLIFVGASIAGAQSISHIGASWQSYGILNLVLAVAIAMIAIYVFDMIRERSYRNSRATWIAHAELKKANELKNQLLKIAANDMKDPLQVIIGYTDLLKMKLQGDRAVGEKLKIVHRSTDRMIKLIGGLLEITKIESGKLVLHKREVDLGKVVSASVKSYQQDSRQKNQKLLYNTEGDCFIDGDEMMLRQVANHLISNAIKFSAPGKSIWVSVERQEQDNVITFKVKDEGPGLEQDEIEKVFNKFQQLSNKPTGGEISTGLGLAITKDLVTRHEGTVTVDSEPGKGSTFVVALPMMDQAIDQTVAGIAGHTAEIGK
ncbi:MAG: HAMP domain-containing histidine kinase [bacterium]|nr:HAMP domain-containing histidine kinase [bacterium]